jgi:hypothetical protein
MKTLSNEEPHGRLWHELLRASMISGGMTFLLWSSAGVAQTKPESNPDLLY